MKGLLKSQIAQRARVSYWKAWHWTLDFFIELQNAYHWKLKPAVKGSIRNAVEFMFLPAQQTLATVPAIPPAFLGKLFECQNCREEGRPWVVRLTIHQQCEICGSEAVDEVR
jgi:hypothetical protein